MTKTHGKPDIVAILEGEGVGLTQKGRYHWACCPLHQEKTPSFAVDPERQRFRCFGCHASGDVIDFVRTYRGLDFGGALQHLGMGGGDGYRPPKPDPELAERRALGKAFERWADDYSRKCCDIIREANRTDAAVDVPELLVSPGVAEAYLRREIAGHHLSVLGGDDEEEKLELWRIEGGENE